MWTLVNNLQQLISPYNTTPGSCSKVMRINKIISRKEAVDCYTNSP